MIISEKNITYLLKEATEGRLLYKVYLYNSLYHRADIMALNINQNDIIRDKLPVFYKIDITGKMRQYTAGK